MDHIYIETERLIITEFDECMAQAVHENSLDDDNPPEAFSHGGRCNYAIIHRHKLQK